MKQFLFGLLLFGSLALRAQTTPEADPPPQSAAFSVWSQRLDMTAYIGKKYRLQAAIRAEIGADSAGALVFIRNEYPKGGRNAWTYMDNMAQRLARHRDWKTYTLESTVDATAPFVGFGCNAFGAGNFYYDDLRLSVETSPGKWTDIPIQNGNFEQQTLMPWVQTQLGVRFTAKDAFAKLDNNGAFEGKQCLRIENRFIPYGSNPKTGRFFEVNGIRLYAEIYGDGPPLVMLHTGGGSIEHMSLFIASLAQKHQVIAFDSRGHGKSGGAGTPLSYALMADDIARALEQLGIDSTDVCGYSDGAIQGLWLAVQHPKLVKKLLAGTPNITADSSAVHGVILEGLSRELETTTSDADRQIILLMLSGSGLSENQLANIQCPVLITSADRDLVRLEHTLHLFNSIPKAQLCIIPGSAHNMPWEKMPLFLQITSDFFEKPFIMPDTRDWFRE